MIAFTDAKIKEIQAMFLPIKHPTKSCLDRQSGLFCSECEWALTDSITFSREEMQSILARLEAAENKAEHGLCTCDEYTKNSCPYDEVWRKAVGT